MRVLLLCGLLLVIGLSEVRADDPKTDVPPTLSETVRDLLQQKLALLEKRSEILTRQHDEGLGSPSELRTVRRQILETRFELAETRNEQIALVTKMLIDVQKWETLLRGQFELGEATLDALNEVQIQRLDLMIRLVRLRGE